MAIEEDREEGGGEKEVGEVAEEEGERWFRWEFFLRRFLLGAIVAVRWKLRRKGGWRLELALLGMEREGRESRRVEGERWEWSEEDEEMRSSVGQVGEGEVAVRRKEMC